MAGKLKLGAVVTIVVSLGAVVAIGAIFTANASPYVDVEQAKSNSGDGLHLLGTIQQSTLQSDPLQREISFDMVDDKGKSMHVDYHGEAISNIGEATKVVAVGSVKQGEFMADKLLIKCPSKYEDGRRDAVKSS